MQVQGAVVPPEPLECYEALRYRSPAPLSGRIYMPPGYRAQVLGEGGEGVVRASVFSWLVIFLAMFVSHGVI